MCKVRKSDATQSAEGLDRRGFLKAGVAGAAAMTTLAAGSRPASAAENPYAEPANPGLPPSDMVLNMKRAALVVTDPQVDFLRCCRRPSRPTSNDATGPRPDVRT